MQRLLLIFASLFLIITSCKKKSSEESSPKKAPEVNTPGIAATTDSVPSSSKEYYLVFFDGTKAVKYEQMVNSIYNGAESSSNNNYYKTGGTFVNLSNSSVYAAVAFGKNYETSSPSSSTTYNAFTTGSNTFGNDSLKTQGFIFSYSENGTHWSSDNGTASQTGMSVNITSKSSYSFGASYYEVSGTVNCNVYDGKGNSKRIRNGKFKTLFSY